MVAGTEIGVRPTSAVTTSSHSSDPYTNSEEFIVSSGLLTYAVRPSLHNEHRSRRQPHVNARRFTNRFDKTRDRTLVVVGGRVRRGGFVGEQSLALLSDPE